MKERIELRLVASTRPKGKERSKPISVEPGSDLNLIVVAKTGQKPSPDAA